MHNNPLLSVCIPTYNRAPYLNQAISSIFSQDMSDWGDKVEVCVSDNASTDDTCAVIAKFRNREQLNVVYHRNATNLGADRNYLKAVDLARGKYCWFLGSDDAIKPGAISKMLSQIRSNSDVDIFVCSRTACELKTLNPIKDEIYLAADTGREIFNLSEPQELLYYFSHSSRLAAVFAYLSSIVFRREKWLTVSGEDEYVGTAYVHAFKLLSFIKFGCHLKYILEPLVYARMGQDSFSSGGIAKRVILDFAGYKKIADALFQESHVNEQFMRILGREYNMLAVIRIRSRCSASEWETLREYFLYIGLSKLLISAAEVLRYPVCIARFIKRTILS